MTTNRTDTLNRLIAEQKADIAAGRLKEIRNSAGKVIGVEHTATWGDTPERRAIRAEIEKAKALNAAGGRHRYYTAR